MSQKLQIILISLIILLASFLRLNNISAHMQFLGDEGRDVMVAKNILSGKFTLLGPRSSAGDFYMGPFYYYLITPFLYFSHLDPVGPAIMVALFSIATVFLIYHVTKSFFNYKAGLFAALLYACSSLVLSYSHSSWNPNILPFFSLLLMYLLYLGTNKNKKWTYYLFPGIIFGLCLQLHYLSLFLTPVIIIYLFLENKKSLKSLTFYKSLLAIFIGTTLSLLPLILFEIRHNFLNTQGIYQFLIGSKVDYSTNTSYFSISFSVFTRTFSRLVLNFPPNVKLINYSTIQIFFWNLSALLLAISSIYLLFKQPNKKARKILILWLISSCLLFGFYKKEIYDYLLTVVFPLPFILTGFLLSKIINQKHYKKFNILLQFISLAILTTILFLNLTDMPLNYPPNNQKKQARDIAQFVINKTSNKSYNFALISGGNSDHAYRYYLDVLKHPPVILENLEKDPDHETATKQLLVVCEEVPCNPIGHPLHDIAAFGRAEIVGEWSISVVKIYKLTHYIEKNKN